VTIPEFTWKSDDPFAAEHAALARWVSEGPKAKYDRHSWMDVAPEHLDSGQVLLEAPPEKALRYIRAALQRLRPWHESPEHLTKDRLPVPYRFTLAAIRGLLRPSLPYEDADLIALVRLYLSLESWYRRPWSSRLARAAQRHVANQAMDSELRGWLQKFAAELRASCEKEEKRLGTVVEQLCLAETEQAPEGLLATPQAAPAGDALVLYDLKCRCGMAEPIPDLPRLTAGPDRFRLPSESPLRDEHQLISELFEQMIGTPGFYHNDDLGALSKGREIFALDSFRRGRFTIAAAERGVAALLTKPLDPSHSDGLTAAFKVARILSSLIVEFDREGLFDFLLYLSTLPASRRIAAAADAALFDGVAGWIDQGVKFTEGERYVLHLWRAARIGGPPMGVVAPDIARLTAWIGDGTRFYLAPGEFWSDAVNTEVGGLAAEARAKWCALLKHLLGASSSRPSARWLAKAAELMKAVGAAEVRKALERWFPLVEQGRPIDRMPLYVHDTRGTSGSIQDENADVLRGMLWMVPLLPRPHELARMVGRVAVSAYRKVPGVGPRAPKVGNAAVYALSELVSPEAIGQLAMLKVRVRFGTTQKEIEKAFDAVATQLQLARDQVEEMSVPTCGLESGGRREEKFGSYRAELTVTGSNAELKWFDGSGKQLNALPAAAKKEDPETLKELQQALKDIRMLIPVQRDRIDALFLERKSWRGATWRECYLDHPLVGTIARRLIWCVDGTAATFLDGRGLDIQGQPVEVADQSEVTLWHPVGRGIEEIVPWRRRIESLEIVQPFKQAHREIYLITEAERRTAYYSNRFAAHVLKQHQFNALCGARRWKNKLRLNVDDWFPPATRDLPAWNLRAEFQIVSGVDFDDAMNDSAVFLRVGSDQVRFYRTNAAVNEPMRLEEVPELVFSEIMRDVDLFVGVASVGNDPTWVDGGPEGRYRDYWQVYSFGELSETALTRRDALQRLVPRLKIAGRCTLDERFLIVRGDRRTYKIHLGSGNILMEPNNQYLCIVPDARINAEAEPAYLSFEGDRTLSIILSKAFLLADDRKIKDSLINRQIGG
jgi:hypothetical protein